MTAQVRLIRRLRERADSDKLTELLNHGAGEVELRAQIAHAGESGQPLSIVLLDIDHFKAVNDDHGHAMGDLVLERLGRLINRRLNRQDVGVRWGGEEFLLILIETDAERARQAAESFRSLIAETGFHDEIAITVSFGVAQWRPGESLEALFKRADVALYEAKDQGRNRVCVAA